MAIAGRNSRLIAAGVVALASVSGHAWPSAAANSRSLFVDAASVGGPCSDDRAASEVSERAPWCSLERAVRATPAGRTVIIRGGDYPALAVDGGPPRTSYVTFRAARAERVTVPSVTVSAADHLAFRGLIITPGSVNLRAGTHHVRLERNTISSQGGSAINFSSSPGDAEIADVSIRRNRILRAVADGIQLKNFRNVVIEDNEITGVARINPAEHSDVLQTVFGGTGLVFRGNWVHNNAAGVLLKDGKTAGVVIEGNTFTDNKGDGQSYTIQLFESASPRVVNNTIWNNTYGVAMRSGTTGAVIRNNILQSFFRLEDADVAYEDFNLIREGERRGERSTGRSPRFVAADSGDYRLSSRSPGVDAGTSTDAPRTDRLGRPRRDDPKTRNRGGGVRPYYDLGAEERQPPRRR